MSRIPNGDYCSFVSSLWSSGVGKHFHCLQVSASKFQSDNLFLYVAPLITRDKCGCHTEVLSDCDRSVISSCSTYISGDDGSDCFPLCGGSISSICILHLHLKHINGRSSCITKIPACSGTSVLCTGGTRYIFMCVEKHISRFAI